MAFTAKPTQDTPANDLSKVRAHFLPVVRSSLCRKEIHKTEVENCTSVRLVHVVVLAIHGMVLHSCKPTESGCFDLCTGLLFAQLANGIVSATM